MQPPDRPFDGTASGDGAPSYEWLDEWLCEYVDGTMDPSVEAVFEQYVEANPELKAHVERLRQTRELLRGCEDANGSSTQTAVEVTCEVKEGLLTDSSAPDLFPERNTSRPVAALGLVSSIAVALVVGFLAGSMLVDPATLSSTPTTAVERQVDSPERTRAEAPARPSPAASVRGSRTSSFPSDDALLMLSTGASDPASDTGRVGTTFMTAGER
jgi:anti-sigma factor RsiW